MDPSVVENKISPTTITALYRLYFTHKRRLTSKQIIFAINCSNRLGATQLGKMRQEIFAAIRNPQQRFADNVRKFVEELSTLDSKY